MCHMLLGLASSGVCGRGQQMTTTPCCKPYSRKAPAGKQQLTPHPMLNTPGCCCAATQQSSGSQTSGKTGLLVPLLILQVPVLPSAALPGPT